MSSAPLDKAADKNSHKIRNGLTALENTGAIS
jgi:hypothetical protein